MADQVTQKSEVKYLEIDADEAGQRIDNYLLARLKGVPKSRIYRLLRRGEVRVNKGRIKPEYRIKGGDIVRLPPIRVAAPSPVSSPGAGLRQLLSKSILLETKGLLVINKPSGLAVHGGSGIDLGLIEALRATRDDAFLELVHRLDRGTSGCLLVARKRSTLRALQQQLREGQVEKTYLALALGRWPKGLDRIDAPLKKRNLPTGDHIVQADIAGKRAVTHFQVIKRYTSATLLEVGLETGRTHQIRVHAQLAGHSLAGDEKYGDDGQNRLIRGAGLKRMFLHAHRLKFVLPETGELLTVESPLPKDLSGYLSSLK